MPRNAPESWSLRGALYRRWQVRELMVLGIAVALPIALMYTDVSGFLIAVSILIALGVATTLVVLGGEWGLMGPHFFYDIIRLARRGRSTGVRIAFVLVLLGALAFVYSGRFHHRDFVGLLFDGGRAASYNDMANLAEAYVFSILIVQNLAVLLLTPAYVASAVAEERERRTLELLFTSHLNNREIVLGKLGARAMHMWGVLLASLPILSLSQLLGGVDMGVLLANFFNTALNLLTVGSICILVSALSRTVFTAVMTSYAIILPFLGCFSMFSMNGTSSLLVLWQRDFGSGPGGSHMFENLAALAMFHAMVAGTCLTVAISTLRSSVESEVVAPRPTEDDVYRARRREPLESRIVKSEPLSVLPPIEDAPLLWKEMYLGGPPVVFSPAFWVPLGSLLIPLLVMFLFVLLDMERGGRGPLEGFNLLLRCILVLLAGLFCLGVGNRACASVVRERQQGTLDALLTLPVTGEEILQAKWMGGLYRGWGWALFYVPLLLFSVATGVIHVYGGILLLAAPVIHGVFLASLGIYLSVVSRTVLAAQMKLALGLVAIIMVGILGTMAIGGGGAWQTFINTALNPIVTWYQLGFAPWEWIDVRERDNLLKERLTMALVGLILYAGVAGVLWILAQRAFRSERFRISDK